MRILLSCLFCGALLATGGSVHAQQRTGTPPSIPIPLPPQAQKRDFPRLPIPDVERSEDRTTRRAKGKAKLRGWQRPDHPGRGHAYGRGKKGDHRAETSRRRPAIVRRRSDRQPRRLPRRVGDTE